MLLPFFAILFLLVGCVQPQPQPLINDVLLPPGTPLESLQNCWSDSDCQLVQWGCCSCSMGGSNIAINSAYVGYYRETYVSNCEVRGCLAVMNCNPSEIARCVGVTVSNPGKCETALVLFPQ